MPESVKKVGEYTVAFGEGKPKQGDKQALSPIYRCASLLERSLAQHVPDAIVA